MKRSLFFISSFLLFSVTTTVAQKGNLQQGDYGYLYCHMNDRGRAWTAYALSRDGFHYHDLLNGDSIFSDAEHGVSRVPHAMPTFVASMMARAI